MRWPLSGSQIIGATQPLRGRAVFVRAPLVIERPGEPMLLKVHRYDPGWVEGEELTREDWSALLRTREAMELGPLPLCAHAALWLLRPGFLEWHEARLQLQMIDNRGAGAHALNVRPALLAERLCEDVAVCVVDEQTADQWRERWAERIFLRALREGRGARYEEALPAARQAFHLSPVMEPKHIALLAALFGMVGQEDRGRGYLQMAANSRGEAFRRESEQKRVDFQEQFQRRASANQVRRDVTSRRPGGRLVRMDPSPSQGMTPPGPRRVA